MKVKDWIKLNYFFKYWIFGPVFEISSCIAALHHQMVLLISCTHNTLFGSYLLHPTTFHPRTLILNFSSLPFILNNSSFLFNPLDFSFTNSSPPFYPTPCNLFQIICYISYPLNSYSSKWDLLFHTFNLIRNISSSSNQSLDFISLT